MLSINRIIIALLFLIFSSAILAEDKLPTIEPLTPSSLKEFILKTKINGNLRLYNFTRNFGNPNLVQQNSLSLGGRLNVRTAPIYGWSAVASYYSANAVFPPEDFNKADPTLPGRSMNLLGQYYLQYKNPVWLLRGGSQLIYTPWLSPADTRMIPSTYQGIYTVFSPIKDLRIVALRINRFKSRTSRYFNRTNLYNPNNFGGTPIPQITNIAVPGAFAGGLTYKLNTSPHTLLTQWWYYKFFDFGNFLYMDTLYTLHSVSVSPFFGVQGGREWGDGENYLAKFGYGSTNATFYGLTTGFTYSIVKLTLGYNKMFEHNGAYLGGNLVSPYTTGYAFDPLYTTAMIGGLVEMWAGSAVDVKINLTMLEKQLRLQLLAAKYFLRPYQKNMNEIDLDVIYRFKQGLLKGLILRNRFGIQNGSHSNGRFLYNRVMIQYDF